MLRKTGLIVLIAFITFSCTKNSEQINPNNPLVGTWKIESAIVTDNTRILDYWRVASTYYPCVNEISYTFGKDYSFSTYEPPKCTYLDGSSFSLLPVKGTYSIEANKLLKIIDTSNYYISGDMTIANGKVKWTIKESVDSVASTIDITFVKK